MTNKEYVPEVGEVCEYTCINNRYDSAIEVGEWYQGKIIAYYDNCVWTSDNGVRPLSNTVFRPLKTQQEIEREEAIHSLVKIIKDEYKTDAVLAARILNSGYRKVGDEVSDKELTEFCINKEISHAAMSKFAKNFKIYPRGDDK